MSNLNSDALRKIMLRRFIADYEACSGQSLTQGKLAEMLGVKQAQISQYIGPERRIPDRRWQDIVRVFGQDDKATAEDYSQFEHQLTLKGEIHHGQLLRQYLQKRNIAHKEAAERLQVSAAAVTNFLYSEQFRPDLLQKLKEELGFWLHTPRNAVYLHSSQKVTDFAQSPVFDLAQIGIEYDLEKTIVVQVESDDLLPAIPPGAKAVAVLVEDYKHAKGLSVLRIGEGLALGEITHNDLLDKGFIALLQRKGLLRVLEADIVGLYKIVLSLTVH